MLRSRRGPRLQRQLSVAGARSTPAARPRWSIPATPRRCWPRRSGAAGPSARCGTRTGTPITPAATWRSRQATGARISGPGGASAFPAATSRLAKATTVRLGEHVGRVIAVPGHTLGHIALDLRRRSDRLRRRHLVRHGLRPAVRRHARSRCIESLRRIAALPAGNAPLLRARIYARRTPASPPMPSPDNSGDRGAAGRGRGSCARAGEMTVPTTVAEELATNPFVRAADVADVRPLADGQRQLPFMSTGAHTMRSSRNEYGSKEVAMRCISASACRRGALRRARRGTAACARTRTAESSTNSAAAAGKVAGPADVLPAAFPRQRHAVDRRRHDRCSATAPAAPTSIIRQGPATDLASGHYALVTTPDRQSGLCRGDIAQVVDLTNGMLVGSCVLGDFIPYTRSRAPNACRARRAARHRRRR